MSNLFVVCMGVGTVFVGLVAIVILTLIMSLICCATEKKPKPEAVAAVPVPSVEITNRQEIIAAVSAAVAEDMGTDISGIRILSFKKL